MTEQHTQPTTATSSKTEPKSHPDFKLKIGKTYTALKPGEIIERCSFILSNDCQCWKAGEEICTDVRKDGEVLTYQFCERHVRIQKAIDAGLLKPDKVTETNPPDPIPVPYGPLSPEQEAVLTQEVSPPPKVEEKKEPQAQGTQTPKVSTPSGQKEEPQKEEHHHFWDHEGKTQGEQKK